MYNFCTLFDKNYLARGLTLYHSLEKTGSPFHLYVFAFDDTTYRALQALQLNNLTPISLSEFEDPELLRIKPTRSRGEYCWTCTPSTILYCLKTFSLDNCTYLDADMYFYQDPGVLINEKPGDCSVIITEHRYTPRYDQSAISGIYCVQFVYFRNDDKGLAALSWWRNACLEWCYARPEDGKFGDQKYLDDWTTRFEGVWVLQNLGGGLAPWNVQQYEFDLAGGKVQGKEKQTGTLFTPVFFHFHGLKMYRGKKTLFAPSTYHLPVRVIEYFYRPYKKALEHSVQKLAGIDSSLASYGLGSYTRYLKDKYLKDIVTYIKLNILRRHS